MNTRSTLSPALIVLGSFSLTPVQAAESESIIIGNAQLDVVLGAKPTPPEMRVKKLLAERLLDRSGIALATNPEAAGIWIVAGTVASNEEIKAFAASRGDLAALGADGYVIEANAAVDTVRLVLPAQAGRNEIHPENSR